MQQDKIQNDDHSNYREMKARSRAAMSRGVWTDRFDKRFVSLAEREMRSDLPREAVRSISEGKHFVSYRGIPMAKDPFDMVLYEMLFFEIQPRTVIELGSYTGASAMWMADTLRTLQCDAHVYSVDIDLELVDDAACQHAGMTFLQGDCRRIQHVFPREMLARVPHPLVVIDDAHVEVDTVYEHFHRHGLHSGDYLIVEDTIPWIPGTFGDSADNTEWGDWKWEALGDFFARHAGDYMLDRYYTDFFGYNVTWNWNGFLKRI